MKRHTDPKRTTPIGMARYARDFLETALAADEVVGSKPGFEVIAPVPVMYLVGHSIELGLKSFLLFRGVPLTDLPKKKYGHNLDTCFKKAKELGLLNVASFSETEVAAMHVLNELYCTKQLNYIESGSKQFPVFGEIQAFCEKLLDGVGPHVGYK